MNSERRLDGPPGPSFPEHVFEGARESLGLKGRRVQRLLRGAVRVHARLVPTFPRFLERLLRDGGSLLDVGCGKSSPLRFTDTRGPRVGIDVFLPYLLQSRAAHIHDAYILGDLRSLGLQDDTFETVLSLNVIEHLTRADGQKMLGRLERWARRRVIVYTSNGFRHQDAYDDNPTQEHLSGWRPEEFEDRGFRVYGVGGWRRLLRFRVLADSLPPILWNAICNLSGLLIAHNAAESIDMCCVKDLN